MIPGALKDDPSAGSMSRRLSRRDFVKFALAGSAASVSGWTELNAGIYQSLDALSQKYGEDESPDGAYWDAIRKYFLFEDGLIMMNNGTVGPLPEPVFNTLVHYVRYQVRNPYDVYNYLRGKREEVREKLARFINASPDEVVVTHNTTEGLNLVVNGLDLAPGDEVLVSNMEHMSAINPWRLKAQRFGVKIKTVRFGLPPQSVDEIVNSFAEAITPKTKIISVGHTVFISGLITPIRELSRMAHARGVLVLADSAHGLGMMNLDMKDLGADFFASSPYKWLGAPTGVGLLYVKKEVQDRLWPTIVSAGWDTTPNARKYDPQGQRSDAVILAFGDALDFMARIGKERAERRIKTLAAYLKRELNKIPGVKVNTPLDPYLSAGLTAFTLEGVKDAQIVDYVRSKYNMVIRAITSREAGTLREAYAVRVSTPIYISMREIDLLIESLKQLSRHRI